MGASTYDDSFNEASISAGQRIPATLKFKDATAP
jgi:hypothetical protein